MTILFFNNWTCIRFVILRMVAELDCSEIFQPFKKDGDMTFLSEGHTKERFAFLSPAQEELLASFKSLGYHKFSFLRYAGENVH